MDRRFSFLILSGLFLLAACSKPQTDEAMIEAKISQLQQAIENHDQGDFMEVIDEHYTDQLHNDRKNLQRMLLGFFLRYKDISVFASAHQIEVNQIRANVQSQVVVTGGEHLIPDSARHYQVHSCWKKVSGEWLLSCLKWK